MDSDQAARGDQELEPHRTVGECGHTAKFALSLGQHTDYGTGKIGCNINIADFHRLKLVSLFILSVNDFRLRDSELIAFAAHRLNQDGQVQLSSSGNAECIRIVGILYTERYVRVKLAQKSFSDLSRCAVRSFTSRKRAVVNDKVHGDRRLGYLLERNRVFLTYFADRIADLEITDTGDRYDRTDFRFLHIHLAQTVEFVKLGDPGLLMNGRIVIIHPNNLLSDSDGTVVDFTDTDSSYIFIIINSRNQDLGALLRIAFRRRYIIDDRLEERFQIDRFIVHVAHTCTLAG